MAKGCSNSKKIKFGQSCPRQSFASQNFGGVLGEASIAIRRLAAAAVILTAAAGFFFIRPAVRADSPAIRELQQKIEQKNFEIEELEKEIAKYQQELKQLGGEINTLKGAVRSLELTQQKLNRDAQLTEKQIDNANLNLINLTAEIGTAEVRIDRNAESLAEALRLIDEAGQNSLVETLLKYKDLSELWDELEGLERFQESVRRDLNNLKSVKQILEDKKAEEARQKLQLEKLKNQLAAQRKNVAENQRQKNALLAETKNQETEYQKILQRNLERKAAFERELFEFESQLRLTIDQSQIPRPRAGLFFWPLDNIFVTQWFGRTSSSGRLYASGTHNGVDFRAAVGTPVKAALSGVVSHLGNTDEVRGCYSYGRWILIKHNNGLSTLYAHLSQTLAQVGQTVAGGEVIALSGGLPGSFGSGYSTGPHLHFGVFATQGLEPQTYSSRTSCNGAYLPIADPRAYLDPMAYLPPL